MKQEIFSLIAIHSLKIIFFLLMSICFFFGIQNANAGCTTDTAYFTGTLFPVKNNEEPVQTTKIGFTFCKKDTKPHFICGYKGDSLQIPIDSLKSIQIGKNEAILVKWDGTQVIADGGCSSKYFTYSVSNPITNEVVEKKVFYITNVKTIDPSNLLSSQQMTLEP